MQRDRIPNDINVKYKAWLNPGINNDITPKALRELVKQHKYSQDGRETTCTGTFERLIGIPSRHTLQSVVISVLIWPYHGFVYRTTGRDLSLPWFQYPPSSGRWLRTLVRTCI